MALSRASLNELAALAHEAALAPALWLDLVLRAGRVLDAAHVSLGVLNRRGGLIFAANVTELPWENFFTIEANPGLAFSAATSPGTVVLGETVLPFAQVQKTDFFNALMRPHGFWHSAVVNVDQGPNLVAPMGFFRTKHQETFSDQDLRALRALAPHLNRALKVALRLRDMQARVDALAEFGDAALVALILTDAVGQVAEANAAARAVLAEGDGLLMRDGALCAARADNSLQIIRLLREAATGRTMSGVLNVRRPSGRTPFALVVSPTRGATSPFGHSHAVRVAFAVPERTPEADVELIARLYGFTGREAALASLLAQGLSPARAAEALAMRENTARFHIRHLLEKTGAQRLSDVIALLLRGPGVRGA